MIASLGTHCFTAHLFKSLPFQRVKSPFDWLFSCPAMVTHVLSDNFNLLMDPSQQVTVPIERRPNPNFGLSDHPFYRRMGVPSAVFNHHDVVGDASDRKYLRDVVEQFRSMPRNVKKLFVLVTVWPADISVYRSIQKALEQYGDHSLLILDVLGPGDVDRRGKGTPVAG